MSTTSYCYTVRGTLSSASSVEDLWSDRGIGANEVQKDQESVTFNRMVTCIVASLSSKMTQQSSQNGLSSIGRSLIGRRRDGHSFNRTVAS